MDMKYSTFKIVHTRSSHIPTFVVPDILAEMWDKDSNLDIRPYPRKDWFSNTKDTFYSADAHLCDSGYGLKVGFTNGRHRTGWFMQLGTDMIPIGLDHTDFIIALDIGLAVRRVSDRDLFKIETCILDASS